jgi:cell division protein FtsL
VVVCVAGTVLALFGLVTTQVMVGEAAVTRAGLERGLAEKRLSAEQLELEVARLRSPERIAGTARTLGMVLAGGVIVLDPALPSPHRGPAPERGRP